jgi:hypothetical protein
MRSSEVSVMARAFCISLWQAIPVWLLSELEQVVIHLLLGTERAAM